MSTLDAYLLGFGLLAAYCVGSWIRALYKERGELQALYATERREHAVTKRHLKTAEQILALPCQCRCDEERIPSATDTPVFDRVAVQRMGEALERGEVG